MSAPDQISAAHDDVVQTRARMADTVAQIEARVTGQMDAVKAKLDVVQMIRDNPWTALAVATGIGAAISATGTDCRVASAAAEKGKQAGSAAKEAIQAAPAQARSATAGAKEGILVHLDTLAAAAVEGLMERLRTAERQG